MSKYIEIIAVVEGKTEQLFINKIVAPYLGYKGIGMKATQISKPGQKGGDVKFSRVQKDISNHLKQRKDTYVTTFVDFYGLKEWPGLDKVEKGAKPQKIAETINNATLVGLKTLYPKLQIDTRFIPFIAIHEFEALLFCDSDILSNHLNSNNSHIQKVLDKFPNPEYINNSPQTAPSKRLDEWCKYKKFPKTTLGIQIAVDIGVEKMREKCPLFDTWLKTIERLTESTK